jgi:hypothetical protein
LAYPSVVLSYELVVGTKGFFKLSKHTTKKTKKITFKISQVVHVDVSLNTKCHQLFGVLCNPNNSSSNNKLGKTY